MAKELNLAVRIRAHERADWEALRDYVRVLRGNETFSLSDIAREGKEALKRELRFPQGANGKEGGTE